MYDPSMDIYKHVRSSTRRVIPYIQTILDGCKHFLSLTLLILLNKLYKNNHH